MTDNRKFPGEHEDGPIDPLSEVQGYWAYGPVEAFGADDGFLDAETNPFGAANWLSPSPIPTRAPFEPDSPVETPLAPAAAPSITRTTSATGFVTSGEKIHPFANVVITDPNAGAIDTITIWINEGALDGPFLGTNGSAQGTLTGAGVTFTGVYTLTGSAAAVTKELRALIWTVGAAYATVTQSEFTIQLQSNAYSQSETDQNTNFANFSTVTTLSISNKTGDYIPIPTSIIKYFFQRPSGVNPPAVESITPFYTDNGKKAYLFLTWDVYPANIALPVQILGYDAATNSFVDVTTQFFGSNIPDVVEGSGVTVADFNGDGRPDFFLACWGPDNEPIFPDDQLWLSDSSGGYRNASSSLPGIAAGDWFPSSGVVDEKGDIGIVDTGHGPEYYTTNTFFSYLINQDGKFINGSYTYEPAFPSGSAHDSAFLMALGGDGLADLICSFATGDGVYTLGEHSLQLELFLNPGNGDFNGVKPIVLPAIPFGDGPNISGQINPPQITDITSFKDWRGDFDDLIVISNSAREDGYAIQILMNNGSDGFVDQTSTRLFGAASSQLQDSSALGTVFTADLNGEGPSIITSGQGFGNLGTDPSPSQVFLNNGEDVFTLAYSLPGVVGDDALGPYALMQISGVEDLGGTEYLILSHAQQIAFIPYEPPPVVVHPLAEVNEIVERLFKLTLPANVFSDPNGLALTYGASGPGLTALPSWLTFDSATRTFTATGAPPAGSYVLTVTARDPYGWLAEDTFTLRETGAVPDDFTGDAVSDVLWRNSGTGLYADWILQNGALTAQNLFNPGPPPVGDTFVGTADFNGWGIADPLFQNAATGALTIWNTGDGVDNGGATQLAGEAPSTGWSLAGVADIDVPNSIWLEPCALLWVDAQTGKAMEQVIVNNAISATYTLGDPGAGWSVLGTGDFSGTTSVDILFQNQKTAQLQDWRIDDGAVSEDTTFAGPGAGWSYAGAGDFLEGLGDLHDSLLFANTAGQLKLYNLDDGAATGYAALSAPALPTGFSVAKIGDFNGDGISDVLLYDKTTGATDVGLVNASGEIAAWVPLGVAAPSKWQLAS